MYRYVYILILLVIVISRVWFNKLHENERICDGCEVSGVVRLWEYPKDYYGRKIVNSGRYRLVCGRGMGCGELAEAILGERLRYVAVVNTEDEMRGREELELRSVEVVARRGVGVDTFVVGLLGVVDSIRSHVVNMYRFYIGEPYASLLGGIVLGVKESFEENFYDALVATGTLHVIAASGYNISIVARVIINSLVQVMSRKKALLGAIVGVMIYTLIAGAGPAVLRAAVMGMIAFGAQMLGRDYLADWGLFLSIWLMLMWDPELLESVSFQLSVAATGGILWGEGAIERFIISRANNSKLKTQSHKLKLDNFSQINSMSDVRLKLLNVLVGDLATTLAATLATMPIIMITFERVSLVSPVTNMMLLWLVPPIMAVGGLMVVLGTLWSGLAVVGAWLVWPLLYVFVEVVDMMARVSWASVEVSGVPWVAGLGWWMILLAWWSRKKLKTQWTHR